MTDYVTRGDPGGQVTKPPCRNFPWWDPSRADLLGPAAAPWGGGTTTRAVGTQDGSGSGERGSEGEPGGALARGGRGRFKGPPGGPRSGAPFLLAPGGRVATRAALRGLVVAPTGEGRSAAGGGGRIRGRAGVGVAGGSSGSGVTVGGVVVTVVVVRGDTVVVVVEGDVTGGGHLGRSALDHL